MEFTIKSCSCGKCYSRGTWLKLKFVGQMYIPKDAYGPEEALELRDCTCGSTISIKIAPSEIIQEAV